MIILLLLVNLAFGADFEIKLNNFYTGRDLGIKQIRQINIQLDLSTNFPEVMEEGKLEMEQVGAMARVFLNPTGTSGAYLETRPLLYFKGDDICSMKITNIYFRFQDFHSRLPSSWDRAILRSLHRADLLDPALKKPFLVYFINKKLQEALADLCGDSTAN